MIDDELKASIMSFLRENRGSVAGASIGLLIGIFILVFGFFRTLFLVFCIGVGLFVGNQSDRHNAHMTEIFIEWQAKFLERFR
ncbi:MAG: DUF2273 domain-containing protein [Schwartzia sp.]|nr:DUF2273 domain-containing protein [Schwartzia sp. (in: firmicutes)]